LAIGISAKIIGIGYRQYYKIYYYLYW